MTQATKVEGEATVVNLANHIHLDGSLLDAARDRQTAEARPTLPALGSGIGLARAASGAHAAYAAYHLLCEVGPRHHFVACAQHNVFCMTGTVFAAWIVWYAWTRPQSG